MEEKERFTDLHYLDNQIFVYDNKLKSKRVIGIEECFELLNQQDARIKELENLLNASMKIKTDTFNSIQRLKQENQQLKQSQKELAINELNDILKFIITGCSNYYKPPFEIKKYIEVKINGLES